MTSLVAWLPAFFSIYYAFFRSPKKALLAVYLPVLVLLPPIFVAETLGFPNLTFHETAVIPIFIAVLLLEGSRWKFSLADVLVLLYITCGFISETLNENLHFGINKLASLLCDIFAPYALGKALIYPKGINIAFSQRFVFLMFVNALLGLYELRMTAVPQIFMTNWFFPHQSAADWPPLIRYGFVRLSGPFVQTIFFGLGLTLVLLLNYWLIKTKSWKVNFKNFPPLPFKKGTILAAVLLAALILTFSRGPWLSCLLGFVIIGAAFTKNPHWSFIFRTCFVLSVLFFLMQSLFDYGGLLPYAISETVSTVLYRVGIFEQYQSLIWEKPLWGWGLPNLPLIKSMHSIDNAYLLIFLQNGLPALLFYVILIGWMLIRLAARGIHNHRKAPFYSSLALVLFTALTSMTIAFVTVFMGLQIEVLFYLIIGWSEGLLLSKKEDGILLEEREKILSPRKATYVTA